MNLKQLLQKFHQELDSFFGKEEVDSFFNILLEYYLKMKRTDFILNPDTKLTVEQLKDFNNVLLRLKKQEPIQYILGETFFYGLRFKVNNNTLIPRPETEELVSWILEVCENKKIKILDIGTGSGCIAISLAKYLPKAKVFALDISESALQVAKENAQFNNVEITFIKADILNWRHEDIRLNFDVIVSNPPYVREQEKLEMKPNVVNYEPHQALFVTNNNPLQFYETIGYFAKEHLKSNGFLFFEINQYLGNETQQLLKHLDFNTTELKQDLFGRDRMLKATKYNER